jgi:hypothetical protein
VKNVIFILVMLLGGCSATQGPPSLMDVVSAPPAVAPAGKWTDDGIVRYWDQLNVYYGGRESTQSMVSQGGAISIMGLAGVAALSGGSALIPATIGAGIAGLLGITQPASQAAIMSQGSGLLDDALGEYIVAVIAAGYCSVPQHSISPQGAALLSKILAVRSLVSNAMTNLLSPQAGAALAKPQSAISAPTRRGIIDNGCE